MDRISVIITAFDNPLITVAHVKACLESSVKPFEVIVVNDHGNIELEEMLKDYPVKYAYIEDEIPWNQNGARNLGLYISKGDFVSMEDNDHIPFKNYYEEALSKMNEYDVMTPKLRFVINSDSVIRGRYEETLKTRGTAFIISFARRDKLIEIKGYDERFCGEYGWDVPDFRRKLEATGIRHLVHGNFYVVRDAEVKSLPREHDGKNYKMSRRNYNILRRNKFKKQNDSPILNFKYKIKT